MVKTASNIKIIAQNRRAHYDYTVVSRYEAGVVLCGWEVKSIRAGRLQLNQSYIILRNGEVWLIGAQITPLASASSHVNPDPIRSRKLLLQRKEIDKLSGKVAQRGLTLVPLTAYWCKNKVKIAFALATGKKLADKREDDKKKDWTKQKQRLLKSNKLSIE